MRLRPAARWLALGGIIGPVTFVSTWAIAGARKPGYSPVNDAISDLAASHASTRIAMTIGFVGFGAAVIAFGLALRATGAGAAAISVLATAGFTLGVAAVPLNGSGRDVVHGVFASLGYITLAGAPLLASRGFTAAGRAGWARTSRTAGALAGACLLASALGPMHGLFQRTGLTIGDVWLVVTALQLVLGRELFVPVPVAT
jgi:hypothetical membrane protein